MAKRISATDAKNNFGGLLDDVASLGRVDIVKHGRLVAVVLSPGEFNAGRATAPAQADRSWGETHMIPPDLARAARMRKRPPDFDEP
jgi:prevent-host-death family protein